jgi:hypothetical protein
LYTARIGPIPSRRLSSAARSSTCAFTFRRRGTSARRIRRQRRAAHHHARRSREDHGRAPLPAPRGPLPVRGHVPCGRQSMGVGQVRAWGTRCAGSRARVSCADSCVDSPPQFAARSARLPRSRQPQRSFQRRRASWRLRQARCGWCDRGRDRWHSIHAAIGRRRSPCIRKACGLAPYVHPDRTDGTFAQHSSHPVHSFHCRSRTPVAVGPAHCHATGAPTGPEQTYR